MENRLPSPLPDTGKGTKLRMGGFNILGWLGGGRYSSVYLAEAVKTGRIYALKVAEGGKEAERHLKQEAEILSGLSHPGIVKFYAAEEVNGRLALVLEQVPGTSLRYLLDEEKVLRKLSVKQIESLLAEIMKPVLYLHQNGIIHGDLKPENIAVYFPDSTDAQVKLLDLGLSGEKGKEAGTPLYMAPEAFHGELDYGSDIWSAGIILFELFYGASPVEKLHPHEPLTLDLLKKTIDGMAAGGPAFPADIFSGSRHHRGHDCSICLNFHGCPQKIYGMNWFCTLVNCKNDESITIYSKLQRMMMDGMLVKPVRGRSTADELLKDLRSKHGEDGDFPHIPQNRYEPLELLGDGAQHVVLRARDKETGKEYSLLASPVEAEDEALRLFTSLCSLRPPHFPELLGHFRERGRNYLLLSDMKGRSLKMTMVEKPLQIPEILGLAHRLAGLFTEIEALPAPLVTPNNLIIDAGNREISFFIGGPAGGIDEAVHYSEPGRWREPEPVWNIGTLLYRLLSGKSPAKAFVSPGSSAPLCATDDDRQEAVDAMNRLASRGEGFPSYLFFQEEHVDCLRCARMRPELSTDSAPSGRLCGGYDCRHGNFRVMRFRLPIPVALLLRKKVLLFDREKRCSLRKLKEELRRIRNMDMQKMHEMVWIPPFTVYRLSLYRQDSPSVSRTKCTDSERCRDERIPSDFRWLPPTLRYLPSALVQGSEKLEEMRGVKYGERERLIALYGWDDSGSKARITGLPDTEAELSKILTEGHLALGRQLWSAGYMKHAMLEYEKALFLDQNHQQVLEESVILNCLLDEVYDAQAHARTLSHTNQIKHLKSLYAYIESKTDSDFRERTTDSLVNEDEIFKAFD
jgi:serine/threonine protein kinase